MTGTKRHCERKKMCLQRELTGEWRAIAIAKTSHFSFKLLWFRADDVPSVDSNIFSGFHYIFGYLSSKISGFLQWYTEGEGNLKWAYCGSFILIYLAFNTYTIIYLAITENKILSNFHLKCHLTASVFSNKFLQWLILLSAVFLL